MELKAIYLSYTTWSSIHNRRLRVAQRCIYWTGGSGGRAGLSWDNEHEERARRWRLRRDDRGAQCWRMTWRHEQIPDSPREPLSSFPSIMILNYLGEGLRGEKEEAGWRSRRSLRAGPVCDSAPLPEEATGPRWTPPCGAVLSIVSAPGHTGQRGRSLLHLFCNRIPKSSKAVIFFLSLPPSGKLKSWPFPKNKK